MTVTRLFVSLVLTVVVSALVVPVWGGAESSSARPDERKVRFNRDIRPLLSDRCFICHGFDANQRQADLRLDTWEGLTADLGGAAPVVPGDPDASEVVARIEDEDDRMPPADSGLSLNEDERALIRRWIEEGAVFEPHWAFVTPSAVPVPSPEGHRGARGPIDDFVFESLAEKGVSPSPPADPATLIRRVTLDVTGLPPTPMETAAFVADTRPDAWARLVDRLLASPRFGERMALDWLDAARYADTNGFHHDNARTIWPWRDWVIKAFNANLPYDQFVIEQIAGDLLPDATEQQRIASAFCRMHNINDEGGALDEEYRVEAVVDRIETVSTVFMGLTMGCARCHDHKYDPITQDDYYSLYAYFNSVDERGVYTNDFADARAYPARLDFRPDDLPEQLDRAEASLQTAEAALAEAEPAVERELKAWSSKLRDERSVHWADTRVVNATGGELEIRDDGSVALLGAPPERATQVFTLRTEATNLRLVRLELLPDESSSSKRIGRTEHGNVVITEIKARAVSTVDPRKTQDLEWSWAWADIEQKNGDFDIHNALRDDADGWAPAGHQQEGSRTALLLSREDFGFEGGTELEVSVAYQSEYPHHIASKTRLGVATARPEVALDFPTVPGEWWRAGPFKAKTFKEAFETRYGPEDLNDVTRGKAWNGKKLTYDPDVRDGEVLRLSGERSAFYFVRTIRTPVPRSVEVSLGSDDGLKVFLNGKEVLANPVRRGAAPDQDAVVLDLLAGRNLVVIKVVNGGGPGGFYYRAQPAEDAPGPWNPVALIPEEARDLRLHRDWLEGWGERYSTQYAERLEGLRALEVAYAALKTKTIPVLVMKENPAPTPTFVLKRGQYSTPDETRPVTRRPPMVLGGQLPDGAPDDRLGFARWLVSPEHPLTARVQVNRIWQMIFGAGIVATSENFGVQSEWPSHPELLDWLARWFVDSGWDQKALLRLILNSATYRQSSVVRPEVAAFDPRNRLLSWFPRRRLPGELIRDQALFVAGILVEDIGGPSVRPYQPEGLWREVSIGQSSNTQIFMPDEGDALRRRSLYTFWKRTSPNPQMSAFDAPTREYCVVRRGTTNTPLQALVLWNDTQFLEAARALAERTLAEPLSPRERLVSMFQRVTGRVPGLAEQLILIDTVTAGRTRYASDPEAASELLKVGDL
ncbi:MAG: PSD1 domain-containing protein, partial [Planctomycetes bacterium]|nr:PSD1 domain-containing protein [Planctomycetota bacterium]